MGKIPDKLYFKIGEVSHITGLPPYVLRFWETEFKKINPKRTASGQRLYRQRDVSLILEIKSLLYERKFTIQGARQHLGIPGHTQSTQSREEFFVRLAEIKQGLLDIREILSE